MLRRLQTTNGKNIDVMNSAAVDMVRGMVAQKDLANKTAVIPADQTGLYFVDKDVQPTGLMSYEGDLSEYDTRLDNIKAGQPVQLEPLFSGERYATDQVVTTGLAVGDPLEADTTTGKLKKSASAQRLVYGGTFIDNGHTLYIVQVK